MKKLQLKNVTALCLLMLMGFTVKAQNGKPSKGETIEYIQSYFKSSDHQDDYHIKAFYRVDGTLVQAFYKMITLNIETCRLDFEYSYTQYLDIVKPYVSNHKFSVNLDNVESISHELTYTWENGGYVHWIIFKEKNNQNIKNVKLPLVAAQSDYDVYQAQIYKAFEHLRKLCGAPEPLKF